MKLMENDVNVKKEFRNPKCKVVAKEVAGEAKVDMEAIKVAMEDSKVVMAAQVATEDHKAVMEAAGAAKEVRINTVTINPTVTAKVAVKDTEAGMATTMDHNAVVAEEVAVAVVVAAVVPNSLHTDNFFTRLMNNLILRDSSLLFLSL